jgi:hypothetical protein
MPKTSAERQPIAAIIRPAAEVSLIRRRLTGAAKNRDSVTLGLGQMRTFHSGSPQDRLVGRRSGPVAR